MAYPPHYLLQFGGTVGAAGGEIWSCGIRMVLEDGDFGDFDEDGWLVGSARDALVTWFLSAGLRMSSGVALTFAKMNAIASTGRYADQSQTHVTYFDDPNDEIRGTFSGNLPLQCAVVHSWETNAAVRGPASKGRIYVPGPSVLVSQDSGLFDTVAANAMAQASSILLNSLDSTVGANGLIRPAIVSNVGAGSSNQIDRVRVDNRIDIQRSRANQLNPVSSSFAVNY